MPLTGLFDSFSIDFACPIIPGPKIERYLLIAVEHLTGWPLVRVTISDTADVVKDFVKNVILRPFGPPRGFVWDNAKCFTAGVMKDLMASYAVRWSTVGEYASISVGRAERMLGTVKQAIAIITLSDKRPRTVALHDVLFGYHLRRMAPHPSPYQLLYDKIPRMTSLYTPPLLDEPMDFEVRQPELLTIHSARSGREHLRPLKISVAKNSPQLVPGDQVLVAMAKALGPLKIPPFKDKWSGPCTILRSQQPLYDLRLGDGNRSRQPIHARRLKLRTLRQKSLRLALPHFPFHFFLFFFYSFFVSLFHLFLQTYPSSLSRTNQDCTISFVSSSGYLASSFSFPLLSHALQHFEL